MAKITTIGLDLAKNVFHVVCCDEHGKVVKKKMLKRFQVLMHIPAQDERSFWFNVNTDSGRT